MLICDQSGGSASDVETKSKNHRDFSTPPSSPDDGDETGEARANPTSNSSKRKRRSIREIVIDSNQRFAATMKSLGE